MSQSSKRPRLHFLPSVSPDPDGELAIARARNDGLLKTRWEQIFARYERDFEGVGDEISMFDDTIVVDNGHIKSMRNARDTGAAGFAEHPNESPSKYDGRRLLRAMTVAPSENSEDSVSDNDADEVLNSIETIADNIITNDESSEDELFDVHSETDKKVYRRPATPRGIHDVAVKSESDIDSLFKNRPIMRSPSVDDLFGTTSPIEPQMDLTRPNLWNRESHDTTQTPDTTLSSLPPREAINRELIREEVRKALEEENQIQESKIDPAWRIPVRLTPAVASKPITVAAPPGTQQLEPEISDSELADHEGDSVWQLANRVRRSRREVAAERNLKRLRAESEDPLQDGFTSDAEQLSETMLESVKRSRTKTTSRSSHQSFTEKDSSSLLQQWRATTAADQARPQSSSRRENATQAKPDVAANRVKTAPKPRTKPKSDSSTVIVQVPAALQTVTKQRSKG